MDCGAYPLQSTSINSISGVSELDISSDVLVLDEADVQLRTFTSPQAENLKVTAEFGYSDVPVTVYYTLDSTRTLGDSREHRLQYQI